MLSCLLRIDGRDFNVDRYLKARATKLVADNVYRRGEPHLRGTIHQTSGFTVLVSEPESEDFSVAVAEAVSFLRQHRDELTKLARSRGVDGISLDFGRGFVIGKHFAQFTQLPVELLRECADIGVEIELSTYATS